MREAALALLVSVPYLLAILAALGLSIGFVGAYGTPAAGVGLALTVFVISTLVGDYYLPIGIHLMMPDLLMLLLGLVTVARAAAGHAQWSDRITQAWLVLGLVWFGLFFVGLPMYRTAAGVGFRNAFYLWTMVAYLLTFRVTPKQLDAALGVAMALMVIVCAVVVYRWVRLAQGAHGEPWQEGPDSVRVVTSFGAQLLSLGVVAGVAMWAGLARAGWGWSLTALLLLPFVLLLQHRTVWIALAAAVFGAIALAAWSRRGRLAGAILPLILGVAIVGGAFVVAPQGRLASGLERSTNTGTLAWRVDSWREMVSDWARSGPTMWPAGQPFGASTKRYIEAQNLVTTVSAHSHYVGLLVNGGLLGLTAHLVAQLAALKRLVQASRRHDAALRGLSDAMLALMIVAVAVYAVAYGTDYVQGIFLGLAYSRALQLRRGATDDAVAGPATAASAHTPTAAIVGRSTSQPSGQHGAVRPM